MSRARFGLLLAVVAIGTAFATITVAGGLPARGPGDPVVFLKGVVRQLAANEYGRAWQTLASPQQRLVPQATYVRCEAASPIPGRLASIEVTRVGSARIRVAGEGPAPADVTAVTLRLRIVDPALGESVSISHTVHAVDDGGRWAWILPPARFRLDRLPSCGSSVGVGRQH